MKEDPTDLSKLHKMLEEKGIEHIYREHPAAIKEPQAAAILGRKTHPVGTHQIRIGDVSIIRGMASFGLFEAFGSKWKDDPERFQTEEELILAL